MPEKTSTKAAEPADLDTTEPAEPEAPEVEEGQITALALGYAVDDFEKRREALSLAITSNSPDPVATAKTYYAFLAETPAGGAA